MREHGSEHERARAAFVGALGPAPSQGPPGKGAVGAAGWGCLHGLPGEGPHAWVKTTKQLSWGCGDKSPPQQTLPHSPGGQRSKVKVWAPRKGSGGVLPASSSPQGLSAVLGCGHITPESAPLLWVCLPFPCLSLLKFPLSCHWFWEPLKEAHRSSPGKWG